MDAYLNIISAILAVIGIAAAYNMDMNNPFVFAPVMIVFGMTMFTFGFTARNARETFNERASNILSRAAEKTVERKMPEIEQMVSERAEEVVDAALVDAAMAIDRELEKLK